MLVMKDNYNKKIAPFDYDYVASRVIPVNVNISMAVMDMISISEVDLVYVLKFRFLMVWYDYRLKYHNLKQKRSLNSLSREEIERLWIPFVVFSNTENQEATKGGDETEVTITREGQFTESPVHVMDEINIFKGVDNGITFQQVYSKTFKCVYQLQLYPFDTQVPLQTKDHISQMFPSCARWTWRSGRWRGRPSAWCRSWSSWRVTLYWCSTSSPVGLCSTGMTVSGVRKL